MASNDYIPKDDFSFQMWAESLCECIAGEPEKYRFTAEEAAELVAAIRDFTTAREACNPFTQTRPEPLAKRDARKRCESACRRCVTKIRRDDSIADGDKIAAGVPVKDRDHGKPIPCPQTSPLLNVLGGSRGNHKVIYADSLRPESRARPYGAKSLELAIEIAPQHAAPLSEASRRERITRNPIVVEFDKADDGAVATYYGRWTGARGETGPWSLPVSLRIAA